MVKKLTTIRSDIEKIPRLNKLSESTRVPKQVYIREGIDITLTKHEKKLKRKRNKAKDDNRKGGIAMRKTSFIMATIFTVVGLSAYVYGKCIDECIKKCDATIDEKFRSGEGYIKGIQASTDYLKMKNQQKVKCYGKCEGECAQNIKKDTVDIDSELKKEPQEQ